MEPNTDTADKAHMLLSMLEASARPMEAAGTVAAITEDQLPGGLDAFTDAIEYLRGKGYDIRHPRGQRDLSLTYPECRGRVIVLVATPQGVLLKHAKRAA